MPASFFWRSRGGRTGDNRDHCGIGIRDDGALCIVLDGSTRGRDSGGLVRRIATDIVDWYVDAGPPIDAGVIMTRLGMMHTELAGTFPQASASYMLVHLDGKNASGALWAGDCLLGRRSLAGETEWLSRPHTLANALDPMPVEQIAALGTRHLITRSFRPREFMRPDRMGRTEAEELILATDGFWAELDPDEQTVFLDEMRQAGETSGDDRSVLRIRLAVPPTGDLVRHDMDSDSLYARIGGPGGRYGLRPLRRANPCRAGASSGRSRQATAPQTSRNTASKPILGASTVPPWL